VISQIDDTLFEAAYLIRLFANNPVNVNSSYRTPLCNKNCGGAPDSFHLLGKALDLNCGPSQDSVNNDILAKGPLYRSLRQCGINGFGISPSFLHIDTRIQGSIPDPEFGTYSLWFY
jgi:zinc D-Ala-D-Ala carboxypeptidase